MTAFKRILSLVLCVVCVITLLPSFAVPASAASTTINDFGAKTNLSYDQYNALRTGKISAVKKGNVWYYKFTKGSTTVLVKTTAFSSSVGNDYSKVNSTLTNGVMTTSGVAKQTSYVYKDRVSVQSRRIDLSSGNRIKSGTMKSYTTYFSFLHITANRVDDDVKLECLKHGHVQFVYSDKIQVRGRQQGGYKAPSTASEYVQALKRSTSNSISTTMTPVFNVSVTKPGTNRICLNNARLRGKGETKTSANVTDLIDVAITTAKITASMATGIPYSSLYSMYKQVVKMKKSSAEYVSNQMIWLSKNNKNCLKAEFTSPTQLKRCDDYFLAEVQLSGKLSTSGTKSAVKVTFSIQ